MLRGLVLHVPLTTLRGTTPTLHVPGQVERLFSLSARTLDKPLPPRLKLNDADLTISYLKGSGPGGQKIVSPLPILHHPVQKTGS